MTALAITVASPNNVYAPLTLSGAEDTVVVTIPPTGRQFRRLQLVCDSAAWRYSHVAGGIAADTYFPVAMGVPLNIDLQKTPTTLYVLGTAAAKLRILQAN